MKILIFENSKQIEERLIDLISETIKDTTFYKAGSYAEAQYFLNECNPDTVLLDLKYPGNSSIELLKKIKSSNPEIVVIALSSGMNDSDLKKCEPYRADFIFDKYADFEQIPEVIGAMGQNA